MPWPALTDFSEAVQNPRLCFRGTEFEAGTVSVNQRRMPLVFSGAFACVYRVSVGGQTFAVRCFTREVKDQQTRYNQLSEYLINALPSSFVHFKYLEDGISLKGTWYPVVRMEWVEGKSLSSFVGTHLNDPDTLRRVAAQWRGDAASLRGLGIAHNDLQHGNVMVQADGRIRLVDYDGMFLPQFRGERSPELGHKNFQHPLRTAEDYDAYVDNFPSLVVYLSLRAIASDPGLWAFYNDDNLIFTRNDYADPGSSEIFNRLKNSPDLTVAKLTERLEECCALPVEKVPDLEAILRGIPPSLASPPAPTPPPPTAPPKTESEYWQILQSQPPAPAQPQPVTPISASPAQPAMPPAPPPVTPVQGIRCSTCNLTNNPAAQFCTNCGTAIAAPASPLNTPKSSYTRHWLVLLLAGIGTMFAGAIFWWTWLIIVGVAVVGVGGVIGIVTVKGVGKRIAVATVLFMAVLGAFAVVLDYDLPVPVEALLGTPATTIPTPGTFSAPAPPPSAVGNQGPAFAAVSATRSVAENTAAGMDIGDAVTADDDDGDTLTYTLGGADASAFRIMSGSEQLQTSAVLDYEAKSSYTVTVTAADPSSATDSITVTIGVTNVDEAGSVSLLPVRPQVGTGLTATLSDPDGGMSGTAWRWARSADGSTGWADISGASAASYVPVSGDQGMYLRATASYTDRHGSGKSAQVVSDNAVGNWGPAFAAASATRSVAENTAAGMDIGDAVTADDDDGDTLTYTLGGADASAFRIVSGSGQLQTSAVLDYEAKSSYTVTVTAADPSSATDSITVTIGVTNVDEAGSVSLLPVRPQVGTGLTATLSDPDGGMSGTAWRWARSADGSTGWADISGASAASYVPVSGDQGMYLRATASYTDRHGSGKSAQVVSDNAVGNRGPTFAAASATRSVAENTAAGMDIGDAVTADDDDGDTLTYTLGGADASAFRIVSGSGQLQTSAVLDYEAKSSYTVTVTAADPSSATDNIAVTIGVTNVDEAGTVSLLPVQPQVGTGLTATLSDPDGGMSGTAWRWARSANGSTGWADISGASAASYVPVSGDQGMYLRATASYTDRHGSGKSAQVVSDNAVGNWGPAFAAASATRSVAENTAAGMDIGDAVTAGDDDGDTLTYTLGGADASAFRIVSGSGQLQTSAVLDYEAKSSYTVTVTAADPSSATDNIAVTIGVTNVDEAGTVSLLPVQPQVGTGLTATLSDPDGGMSGTAWRWARSANGSTGWADISGASAASYVPVSGDQGMYLRATASYTDRHGSGKSAQVVSDNAVGNWGPAFAAASATRSVAENTAAGMDIGDAVTADDDDGDTLTYTLGGADASAFRIVSGSGQLQTSAVLDYEAKSSYTVTVTAADPSSATDSITVTIGVTNVDEAGSVSLLPVRPQVGTGLTATLSDPGRRCERNGLAMGQVCKWEHGLGGHQRRSGGQLCAGQRRPGDVPAGHGVLH